MVFELDIENEFQYIMIGDLSDEAVFKCFFFSNCKVVFIIDNAGQLSGIITLGDFIKSKRQIKNAVNKKYLFVRLGEYQNMLLEAERIYNEHKIESDIPILDENNILIACIRNNKVFTNYNKANESAFEELKSKILEYQSSYYYKKEIDAFLEIISNSKIYVNESRIVNELICLFGNKFSDKLVILNDAEFYNKIKNRERNKLSIEEKNVYFSILIATIIVFYVKKYTT